MHDQRDEVSPVLCRLPAMEAGFVRKKYDREIKARASGHGP